VTKFLKLRGEPHPLPLPFEKKRGGEPHPPAPSPKESVSKLMKIVILQIDPYFSICNSTSPSWGLGKRKVLRHSLKERVSQN